ncbi:MBL fold metallo-hydrolase [Inmirania thermothiophila]|uniref:Glyoxylase-like metal-dependent hydrolase (Beta-lactamase superfamily II) n=1 Tax=Inmirania thermothiophila TaxID=1750597 RepID=A0A3N1Y8T0_9GAMM|nr:MBL fold metallo-hydrolase [Inmirania thermothiophila]ROR35195.1 glyoxylase-like metal-dependent hydrolase (beta-lactamase superfamily II) [Inmirania thermothiophila]
MPETNEAAARPLPAGVAAYPFAGPPAPGETVEVAPGVRWVRMPLPFALDHVNLWLLEDGDGWAVVDTGYTRDEVRTLWAAVLGRLGTPTRLLVTHGHPDHVGMAWWLQEQTGAGLWMSDAEFLHAHLCARDLAAADVEARCRFFRRHGLANGRLRAIAARGNHYRRGVPAVPETYHRLADGDTLEIGGRRWRVMITHGHSPEHAVLHCGELGVLISGDQVLPRITTNVSVWHPEPEADPIRRYLDSLERLRALPADTLVLPSHGRPFRGLHGRIDALVEHHRRRLAEVLAACRAPCTAADIVPVIFRRELDVHQLSFAMGEAIAHLNHLAAQGRLERRIDDDGVIRFAAAG